VFIFAHLYEERKYSGILLFYVSMLTYLYAIVIHSVLRLCS